MLRIGSKIKNSVFRFKTRSFFSLYDQKGKASLVRTDRKIIVQEKRRLIKKSIGRLNFFGLRKWLDDDENKGQDNKNNNKKPKNAYKQYLDLKESNIQYEQHKLECEKALNKSTEDNCKYLKNKKTASSVVNSLDKKYKGDDRKAVTDLLNMFERDIEKVLVNSKVFGYEELPQLKIKLVSTHKRINESLEQYFNGEIPEEIKEMTNEVYLAVLADNINEFLPNMSDLLSADLIEITTENTMLENVQDVLEWYNEKVKENINMEFFGDLVGRTSYIIDNIEKTKSFELIERQDGILQYFKFLENVIKEVFEIEASKGYLNPFIIDLACEFQMKELEQFIIQHASNIGSFSEMAKLVYKVNMLLPKIVDIEGSVKSFMFDYRHNKSNLEQRINKELNKLKSKGSSNIKENVEDKVKDDVWKNKINTEFENQAKEKEFSRIKNKKKPKVKDDIWEHIIGDMSKDNTKKEGFSIKENKKEPKVKDDIWEHIIGDMSKDNTEKEEMNKNHKEQSNKDKKKQEAKTKYEEKMQIIKNVEADIDKYFTDLLEGLNKDDNKQKEQKKDIKEEQKQDIKEEQKLDTKEEKKQDTKEEKKQDTEEKWKEEDIKFKKIKKDLESIFEEFQNIDHDQEKEKKKETNNNSTDQAKKEEETVKDKKYNIEPDFPDENPQTNQALENFIVRSKMLFYRIDYYEKSIKNLKLLVMRNSLQIQIVQNKLKKKYIKFPKRRILQNRLKTLKLKDQQYNKALQKIEEKYFYIIYNLKPSWIIKEAFNMGEDYVKILEEEYDNLIKEEKVERGKEENEEETDKDETKKTNEKREGFNYSSWFNRAILFYILYRFFMHKREDNTVVNTIKNDAIQEEEFIHMLKNQLIKEINLNGSFREYSVVCMDNSGNTYEYVPEDPVVFLKQLEDIQRENGIEPDNFIPVNVKKETNYHNSVNFHASKYIFNIIIMLVVYKIFKSMGRDIKKMSGKIQKREFKKDLNVRFKDIAGMDEVKEEMFEFVEFLKNPAKFQKLGAKMPKGALLSGPPGTGKTHIAKAIAGEAGIPFLYVSGSEFVEMFVGVGASRVRDLFTEAKKKSPAIIFIDEIDAIAKKRDSAMNNDEAESTLNQLLVEMDGFDTNTNVVIIGSTNLKDTIDPALLRPGRFDRIIEVNLPSLGEREEIFRVYLEKVKLSEDRSIDYYAKRLATLTPGFSPADIANIVNEAAILAVRSNHDAINEIHFERATEKVIAGIEVQSASFEEQKEVISVHECGHAVVSWFLPGGSPLLKLVIKPRSKGALGFAQYLPAETAIYSKEELLDQITGILGGRCAELVFFNKASTGAYDDLQKAKQIALELVTVYGMSDGLKNIRFEYDDYGNKRFSEKTHKLIDDEISKIISEQTEKCIQLIKEKQDLVQKLSNKLLEKEILIFTDIVEILGERPYEPHEGFKRFIDEVDKLRLKYEPTQE